MSREVRLSLGSEETALLDWLARRLLDLVDAPAPADDPLADWEAERSATPLDRDNPVLERLFPPAYDDLALEAEYRRLSEAGLRRGKADDARLMLADLTSVDGQVVIAEDRLEAWLRTVNALRLALAARLGLNTARQVEAVERLPRSDPRHDPVLVFHWLGQLLETLVVASWGNGDEARPTSAEGR
ncbi:MAG: DUF2017 domain-containing protein [Propionibacteriaceae bacterium]|nr:DUF2017 domain-containing protein [Propionibacteriaceae bacterium]